MALEQDERKRISRSFRTLLDSLSSPTSKCSPELMAKILDDKYDQLRKGLDLYPRSSPASRAKLNSGRITIDNKSQELSSAEKDFVIKLSDMIEIDEIEAAAELWRICKRSTDNSYVSTFGLSPEEKFDLKSEISLDNVVHAHFEERLCALAVVCELLRTSLGDAGSPYFSIADSFITRLITDKDLDYVEMIQKQLMDKQAEPIPKAFESWPLRALAWSKQSLMEQKGLLEILFLVFYAKLECAPKQVVSLYEFFRNTQFLQLQKNTALFDNEASEILRQVTDIAVIIGIEILKLEKILEGALPDDPSEQTLFESPTNIIAINNIILSMTGEDVEAIVILAWSLFMGGIEKLFSVQVPIAYRQVEFVMLDWRHQRQQHIQQIDTLPQSPGTPSSSPLHRRSRRSSIASQSQSLAHSQDIDQEIGQDLVKRLIDFAFRRSVFSTLLRVLRSSNLSINDQNHMGYRSVFQGFFSNLAVNIRMQYVIEPYYSQIIECFCEMLSAARGDIAKHFWEQDYESGRINLLDTTRCRFPVQFNQFMTIMIALTGKRAPSNTIEAGSRLPDHAAAEASSYVFLYLKEATSFAQLLPDELITFVETSQVDATLVRSIIPIKLGGGLVLPADSIGRVVSHDEGSTIVQWQCEFSIWRFLAGLLEEFLSSPQRGRDGKDNAANEYRNDGTVSIGMVANIMSLFRCMLAGNEDLGRQLFHHLQEPLLSQLGKETRTNIISLIFQVVRRCSAINPAPQEILTSCIHILISLLPHFSTEVWSCLRITPLLPKTPSQPTSQSYNLRELIRQTEYVNGRYPLTLAFLELVGALLRDALNWDNGVVPPYTTEEEAKSIRELQVEILVASFAYIQEDLFPSYANWRYLDLLEKYLIGGRILEIFSIALDDYVDENNREGTGLWLLQESLVSRFIYEGGPYQVSPLLDIIAFGRSLIEHFNWSQKAVESSEVERLTYTALMLLRSLLMRRKQEIEIRRVKISMLEQLIVDYSVGKSSSDFVHLLANYIFYTANAELPTVATQVLTLLCQLMGGWSVKPSLISYMGAKDEPRQLTKMYMKLLEDDYQREELQVAIWQFIAAAIRYQPGLAVLFLTPNIEYATNQKENTTSSLSTAPASSSTLITNEIDEKSAIRIGLDILKRWNEIFQSKPVVIWTLLLFFDQFWATAKEHYGLIVKVRQQAAFWQNLSEILFAPITGTPPGPSRFDHGLDGLISDTDGQVKSTCADFLAKAHTLRILAMEVHLLMNQNKVATATIPTSLTAIIQEFRKSSHLSEIHQQYSHTDFDARLFRALLHEASQLDPPLPLHKFKGAYTGDYLDAARKYGDSYVYDLQRTKRRIEMIYPVQDTNMSTDYDTLKMNASKFLLCLVHVNQNFSLVDAELVLLRSWKYFLEIAAKKMPAVLWGPQLDQLGSFLTILAEQIATEERPGQIIMQWRFELSTLMVTLLESWFTVSPNDRRHITAVKLIELLKNAIHSDVFSVGDSLESLVSPPFHRPLFEAVFFVLRSLRDAKQLLQQNHEIDRSLRESIGLLLPTILKSLVILLKRSSEHDSEIHSHDVKVTISVVEELVRPIFSPLPSLWLPVLQQYDVIQTLLLVFAKSIETSGHRKPIYADCILYTLLRLANIPSVAERLAVAGIMDVFCNNALTIKLQAGKVIPLTDEGNERHHSHQTWCLMLSIVGSLLGSLGDSEHFLEKTTNFIHLYGAQLNRALLVPSPLCWTSAHFEEIQLISIIFHQLARRTQRVRQLSWNILVAFKDRSLMLLQHFVYYFSHPKFFDSQLTPITPEENLQVTPVDEESVLDEAEPAGPSAPRSRTLVNSEIHKDDPMSRLSPFGVSMTRKIILIVRNIVASLVFMTDAQTMLVLKPSWRPENVIFNAFSSVSLSEPASFGTLLDCTVFCMNFIRSYIYSSTSPSVLSTSERGNWRPLFQPVVQLLQSCLIINTTQLVLQLCGDEVEIVRSRYKALAEDYNELEFSIEQITQILSTAPKAINPPMDVSERIIIDSLITTVLPVVTEFLHTEAERVFGDRER